MDYPAVLPAKLKQATTYNAAVDIRADPLPAPTVIENPNGDSKSEPIQVQCLLGARLIPVGNDVTVDPLGEWQYREFTPTGLVEWSWTVTAEVATDQQVRLELRPVVKLEDSPLNGATQVATFTTVVDLELTWLERSKYWFDTQWPLLVAIVLLLGGALTGVLTWWKKLPWARSQTPVVPAEQRAVAKGDVMEMRVMAYVMDRMRTVHGQQDENGNELDGRPSITEIRQHVQGGNAEIRNAVERLLDQGLLAEEHIRSGKTTRVVYVPVSEK